MPPLTPDEAIERASNLRDLQAGERSALDEVRRYWKGRQRLPRTIPQAGVPREVKALALMSRVNVLEIVVESLSQSLFVEGFRAPREADNIAVWNTWQANKMDARQSGMHRAAIAYGVAYTLVLPGDPLPVIRGLSPRSLTAQYADDPDWPVYALERRTAEDYRLYDADAVYQLKGSGRLEHINTQEHGLGVTPVVRYLEVEDLDREDEPSDDMSSSRSNKRLNAGQVAPLMTLQDQIDETTFNLLVAQHFGAFRQRVIMGWVPPTKEEGLQASAQRVWTFEDAETKVAEFGQTELKGYLESRQATLRHAASLSQTPAHELIGELVNLSAEALAAAEAGRDRKIADRQTLLGESHEQMFTLVGKLVSEAVPVDAQVIWRDTSARAFGAVVDALGKLAQMLEVPVEELWDRVPGATQQDVQRWRASADAKRASEAGDGSDPDDVKERATALGILVRSGVKADSAARIVGLSPEFGDGVPITLRYPGDKPAQPAPPPEEA